jgi:hypothetical protein
VLADLDQGQTREARVILGAAVLDDVLGLVMLAIVSGIVVSGSVEITNVATTILLAALFIVIVSAFLVGPAFLDYAIRLVRHLDIVEAKGQDVHLVPFRDGAGVVCQPGRPGDHCRRFCRRRDLTRRLLSPLGGLP